MPDGSFEEHIDREVYQDLIFLQFVHKGHIYNRKFMSLLPLHILLVP